MPDPEQPADARTAGATTASPTAASPTAAATTAAESGHGGDAGRPLDTTGIVVAVGLFALYFVTLCPTIYSGDAAELATAAHTFGIPHPPGYALYSLAGNLWTRLVWFGDPGWQINLLSAACSAIACLFAYGLVRRLQGGRTGAVFAALSLGLGQTFWSQAVVSEVYAFDVMLAAGTAYLALRAAQIGTAPSLVPAILAASMWVNHRNVNLVYSVTALILLWPALRRQCRPGRHWLAFGTAAILPFLGWLYLPLSAIADPLLNSGNPTTFERFWDVVSARIYQHYLFSGDFGAQTLDLLGHLPRNLGLALIAAPIGLARLARDPIGRRPAVALLWLGLSNMLFASNYAVTDAVIFTLPSCLALAVCAGMAIPVLRPGSSRATGSLLAPAAILGALLLGSLLLGSLNFRTNNLADQTLARDFARDTLAYPRPTGLVLSHVDSVTFSLWYGQAVEGRRADDLLVVTRGQARLWHQEWARRRRPDLEVPIYVGPNAPSRWPALLTQRNSRSIPVYVTANLAGYFRPDDRQALATIVRERPAGLLTELQHKSHPEQPEATIQRNREFWRQVWPHAIKARGQHLGDDMVGLLLHYASMRVIFARYCLMHGDADTAETAATAVLALDPDPLIRQLNQLLAKIDRGYHMSDMRGRARRLRRQARALRTGQVTLAQLRAQPALHELPRVLQAARHSCDSGQLTRALHQVDAVLLVRPRHFGALYQRAHILQQLGRRQDAIDALQKLLRLAPTDQPLRGAAAQKLSELR